MNTEHFESLARLSPALHDTEGHFNARPSQGALRAEALRQLRWQLREWQRVSAMHATGTPGLVVASERAKIHDSLDLLQRAREDVLSWFCRRGALVWTTNAAGGIAAGVSLVSLLADLTRVLAWFDAEPALGADAVVAGGDWSARVWS